MTKSKEIKTVKYSYVPFLSSLEKYLRLPEVQADLHCTAPDYDPNCIQDIHDGAFARNHPTFQRSTYLKIELNSDDLTITNPISHRAHSIFFFYWSLLNVSSEKRSKQSTKRLIAACPKWARKYNWVIPWGSTTFTVIISKLRQHFKGCRAFFAEHFDHKKVNISV